MSYKKIIAAICLLLAGGTLGYWLSPHGGGRGPVQPSLPAAEGEGVFRDGAESGGGAQGSGRAEARGERKVLYWYDPMYPGVRFDQPGKSPFMDMDLQPRYAEEEGGSGMRIDPAQVQNLAVRTERARKGKLSFSKDIPANLNFNDYQLSRIQSRAEGFVEKTYSLAVGDTIRAGEPLADITVPGWASDQSEYLLLKTQNAAPAIVRGVRERLRLSGMPEDMLKAVDATGRVQTRMTIHSPLGGVITELDVYPGMNVGKEMTIATVRGIAPIWVTAEVPERDLWMIGEGRLRVSVLAWPDRAFYSSSHTLLPRASEETRTVPLRLSLENGEGLLRPGMTASVRLRGRGEEAVLIPTQALIDLGHEQRVITRQADGSFLPKLVKVLRTGGESAALSSGLEAGEEVVIFGLFLIDSEANLRGALERMRLDGESGAAMAGVGRREESSEGESSRASSGGGQGRESAENAGALSGAEKE